MNLIVQGDEGVSPLLDDITDQVVILRHTFLNRRFQMPRFQVVKARGGFGCLAKNPTSKVFASSVTDNEDVTCTRRDLIGMCSPELLMLAMADTTPALGIDLSLREYMLVAADGNDARGDTVEDARQRLMRITRSKITTLFELHPESVYIGPGMISYPEGATPVEIPIRKGQEWTAKY